MARSPAEKIICENGIIFYVGANNLFCGLKTKTQVTMHKRCFSRLFMQTRCSINQKKQRRDFTDEFKNDAEKLVTEKGYSCTEVGRRLGVNHTNISRWVRQYRNQLENPTQNSGSVREMEEELKRLRKESKLLLMEREIVNPEPVMVPAGSLSNCKPKAAKLVATR